ncbi:MAG: ABC transporter ATP-binding protein [Thermoleophilia bacterium]
MTSPELVMEDVRLDRGALPVLRGVSLRAAPGEVVALVGPSGCGKSTVLDLLAGLLRPDGGRVRTDGREAHAAVGHAALMPQSDSLMPWRTLLGNVAVGGRLAGLPDREADARARALLDRFGLAGFAEHYPHALSGGMRQRAALARTVLAARGAWLLDEPFGALDALTRADLRQELLRAWGPTPPTVVLVTHDAEEAALLADRVLVCGARPMGQLIEVPLPTPRPRVEADVRDARGAVLDALAAARGRVPA